MADTFRVELTSEDAAFVSLARQHYRVFAEASERHGDNRTAGKLRSQEFYAERLLLRIAEAAEAGGAPSTLRKLLLDPRTPETSRG